MADQGNGKSSTIQLPPADFSFLVESIIMQAQIQLGLLHFGDEKERPEPELPLAHHSIDMLDMLQQKTKGNLSLDEQRLLENALTELRFRYVQVADEQKRNAGKEETADKPLIITPDGGKGTKSGE